MHNEFWEAAGVLTDRSFLAKQPFRFRPIADIEPSGHDARMVEIAGRSYEVIVGSDIQRDGMYLEVRNDAKTVIAEVFHSDERGEMTFTGYISDIPLPLIEWVVGQAKARITPDRGNDS